MFERFTDEARRAVAYGQDECLLLGHQHIGTEHLLLGLLREGDNPTFDALAAAGVTLEATRLRVEHSHGRGNKEPHGHIPFTPRAKQVLEHSLREAHRLGQSHIARPHLLLGLLDVPDSLGTRTLVELGVDLDALAAQATELAADSQPGTQHDTAPGTVASARRTFFTRHPGAGSEASPEAQRNRLAGALRRYARHDEDCDPDRGCTCGLASVLDSLDEDPGSD
jgi:ATP-dependent Clp protease ATP-binding subunit ClpA